MKHDRIHRVIARSLYLKKRKIGEMSEEEHKVTNALDDSLFFMDRLDEENTTTPNRGRFKSTLGRWTYMAYVPRTVPVG